MTWIYDLLKEGQNNFKGESEYEYMLRRQRIPVCENQCERQYSQSVVSQISFRA